MRVLAEIGSVDLPARVLIGARTFAVDRAVPELESIILPARQTRAGRILIEVPDGPVRTDRFTKRRRDAYLSSRETRPLDPDTVFFDFRPDGLDNWSHALNYALPLLMTVRERADGLATPRIGLLAADGLPDKTGEVFEIAGFEVVRTNRAVFGRVGRVWIEPNDARLGAWREVVFGHDTASRFGAATSADLPRKVFIPRRDRRTLINEEEVAEALVEFGYETVLSERLPPRDQFVLLCDATDIVAVHGAGLAPMLYRPKGQGFGLVELFNAGHVTNFFHAMAHQLGGRYAAVRARQTEKVVRDAYAYEGGMGPFSKHSLDDFVVDVEALRAAIEIVEEASPGEEAERLGVRLATPAGQGSRAYRDAQGTSDPDAASISSSIRPTSSSLTFVL